jgi:hypothetical protein
VIWRRMNSGGVIRFSHSGAQRDASNGMSACQNYLFTVRKEHLGNGRKPVHPNIAAHPSSAGNNTQHSRHPVTCRWVTLFSSLRLVFKSAEQAVILAQIVPSVVFSRLAGARLLPRAWTRLTYTRASPSFPCPAVYHSLPPTTVRRHKAGLYFRYLNTSHNMDSDASMFSMGGDESDGYVPEPVSTTSQHPRITTTSTPPQVNSLLGLVRITRILTLFSSHITTISPHLETTAYPIFSLLSAIELIPSLAQHDQLDSLKTPKSSDHKANALGLSEEDEGRSRKESSGQPRPAEEDDTDHTQDQGGAEEATCRRE